MYTSFCKLTTRSNTTIGASMLFPYKIAATTRATIVALIVTMLLAPLSSSVGCGLVRAMLGSGVGMADFVVGALDGSDEGEELDVGEGRRNRTRRRGFHLAGDRDCSQ